MWYKNRRNARASRPSTFNPFNSPTRADGGAEEDGMKTASRFYSEKEEHYEVSFWRGDWSLVHLLRRGDSSNGPHFFHEFYPPPMPGDIRLLPVDIGGYTEVRIPWAILPYIFYNRCRWWDDGSQLCMYLFFKGSRWKGRMVFVRKGATDGGPHTVDIGGGERVFNFSLPWSFLEGLRPGIVPPHTGRGR